MAKSADLPDGLSIDTTTKQVSAAVTPALDDATLKLATTDFLLQQFIGAGKHLLEPDGFQVFPGGLIFNWASGESDVAGGYNIFWKKPFPNACLRCFPVFADGVTSAAGTRYGSIGLFNQTYGVFYCNTAAAGTRMSVLAIGY